MCFDISKLSLNLDETKFMLCSNCKGYRDLHILIDNVNLSRVTEIYGSIDELQDLVETQKAYE